MKNVLSDRHRSRGFTLIELLVVIAIIAILAAILFPVFAKAREKARQSSCASNQKQILLGFTQYVQDYDETYPRCWMTVPINGTNYNVNWWQEIAPYIKSDQIFSCPSDASKANQTFSTANNPSYANGQIHISYIANFRMVPNGAYGSPSSLSLAGVNAPASTVLLADGGVMVTDTAPWLTSTVKSSPWILVDPTCASNNTAKPCNTDGSSGPRTTDGNWAGPNPRHSEIINVGFADGHVKAMKPNSWYYGDTPWLRPDLGG